MVERRRAGLDPRPVGHRGSLAVRHSLSAAFVEWMMGLAEGWVTSPEIGLSRNEMLKALGNGVVRQQAEIAVRTLLGLEMERAA